MFPGSSHSFGLHEAIELARALKRLPRRLILYGIEGKSFGLGGELSPDVKEAAPRVADRIVAELRAGRGILENHPASKLRARTKKSQQRLPPAASEG